MTHLKYQLEAGLNPKFAALLLSQVFKEIDEKKLEIKIESNSHSLKKVKKSYSRDSELFKIVLSDGLTIELVNSVITNEKVDCIVNGTNSVLKHMFGGSHAKAISEAGGPQVQKESDEYIAKNGPLIPSQCMVTSAGNLSAKQIIHVACPSWERKLTEFQNLENLKKLMVNVFDFAFNEIKCDSIAMGGLGGGVFGFDIELVA